MTDQPPPQGLNLLKGLLFDQEARRLDDIASKVEAQAQQALVRERELADRIEHVFQRIGTDDRLRHSVAGVIDGALREAEVDRHEELSRAIAPLVVRTIKHQIHESQDEMVDALYPITGRLVQSYVQSAIADMMVEINAKLGGGRPAKLIEQSAATGISPAQLAIADANRLRVEELFLIRRGSGELIGHWERPMEGSTAVDAARPASNRDILTSGYISAIMSLSEEAFGAQPGSFRTLVMENRDRIFVRGSAAHLLAVRCSGSASAPVETVIDEVFLEALEHNQKSLAADAMRRLSANSGTPPTSPHTDAALERFLPNLGEAIETKLGRKQDEFTSQQVAARDTAGPNFRRLYLMLAVIAAPIVLWTGWSIYQSVQTVMTENAVDRILRSTANIKGVPPKIDVQRGGRVLTISGFVPTETLHDQLLSRLAQELPGAEIHNQLGILPRGSGPAEIAISEMREQWTAAQQAATFDQSVLHPVSRARARLAAVRSDIATLLANADPSLAVRIRQLKATLDAADTALGLAYPRMAANRKTDAASAAELATAWQKTNFAEAEIAGLLGGPTPSEKPKSSAPTDAAVVSEELLLSAERMSAAQLGLTQALVLQFAPARVDTVAAALTRKFAPVRTPREELDVLTRQSAIFFDNGTDIRDPASTGTVLDALAELLRANPDLVLRIVGFTDERGSVVLNTNLAQARANRIADLLLERRVSARQLVAIGRQTAKDLTRGGGPGNVNRRVEFEVGFVGEKGDQ